MSVLAQASALPAIISRSDLPRLGLSRHRFYAMVEANELENIAPAYCMRPGEVDDTTAAWATISLRKPSATICLLSALSLHELTDEIPRGTDIALPRGERTLTTRFTTIHWHSFDRATFDLGRSEHTLGDTGLSIGLYSPKRTIIDAFRLRYEVGADTANEGLKRWLRQRGMSPPTLLELARAFPKGLAGVTYGAGDPAVSPAALEGLLSRVAVSRFREGFVLKGGVLLAAFSLRDFADIAKISATHGVGAGDLPGALEALATFRGATLRTLLSALAGMPQQVQPKWANWRRRQSRSDELPERFHDDLTAAAGRVMSAASPPQA